ncbi:MAG: hypothetical protein MZV70_56005 [Desulfobacterales bacterium]|nr:hypothetical protein [Desulfobacterales bacterium]
MNASAKTADEDHHQEHVGRAEAPGPLDLPLDELLQAAFGELQQPDLVAGLGQVGDGPAQVRIGPAQVLVEGLDGFEGPGIFKKHHAVGRQPPQKLPLFRGQRTIRPRAVLKRPSPSSESSTVNSAAVWTVEPISVSGNTACGSTMKADRHRGEAPLLGRLEPAVKDAFQPPRESTRRASGIPRPADRTARLCRSQSRTHALARPEGAHEHQQEGFQQLVGRDERAQLGGELIERLQVKDLSVQGRARAWPAWRWAS